MSRYRQDRLASTTCTIARHDSHKLILQLAPRICQIHLHGSLYSHAQPGCTARSATTISSLPRLTQHGHPRSFTTAHSFSLPYPLSRLAPPLSPKRPGWLVPTARSILSFASFAVLAQTRTTTHFSLPHYRVPRLTLTPRSLYNHGSHTHNAPSPQKAHSRLAYRSPSNGLLHAYAQSAPPARSCTTINLRSQLPVLPPPNSLTPPPLDLNTQNPEDRGKLCSATSDTKQTLPRQTPPMGDPYQP